MINKKDLKDKNTKKQKVMEVRPPSEKASRFIEKAREYFKKRYGDRWEEVLYRTAWSKFGKNKKNRSLVNEVAPPSEKAERFIKQNKKEFKKRYGDRWEEVLYATAWKMFGDKKKS